MKTPLLYSWKKSGTKLDKFWQRYPSVNVSNIGAPASLEDFNVLEQRVGYPLPAEFKAFYGVHNGWRDLVMPNASRLLPRQEIPDYLAVLASRKRDRFRSLVPFTVSLRARDFLALHIADEYNVSVVFVSTDIPEAYEVSESFMHWIRSYADNPAADSYIG